MKRAELIFTAALVPVDYVMLLAAGMLAYALRTSDWIAQWRPVLFNLNLPLDSYFGLVSLFAFCWLIIFAMAGLYKIRRWKTFEEFLRIVVAASAGLGVIIFYIFIKGQFFDSRFIILAGWLLAIILVAFGRLAVKILRRFLVGHNLVGAHNVLIVGGDGVSEKIMEEIKETPALGYNLIGYFKDLDQAAITETIEREKIDDIILANPDFEREKVLWLIEFCEEKHIDFKFVPNLFQTLTINVDFDMLGGAPLIELKRTALDGWGKIAKRIFDFLGAIFFIIVFSPLMILIAIIIKLDSRGPIIYKNQRVSPDGLFNTYKFRSMKIEFCTGPQYDASGRASQIEDELAAKQSGRRGPVFKVLNDPRRTRFGRVIERTSVDELPQFFNVLFGNMSLVGPRPHIPKEVAKYEKWHRKVFNIKPGVTGMAQISGRSEIDFDEEAKLDIFYIENWSPSLDLKILFKTPLAMFFRKKPAK